MKDAQIMVTGCAGSWRRVKISVHISILKAVKGSGLPFEMEQLSLSGSLPLKAPSLD